MESYGSGPFGQDATRPVRARKAGACGLLLALAALATACAPPAGSRSPAPRPSTPILTDFIRYCLQTGAGRDAALDDAKRAKLDIVNLPGDPAQKGIAMVGWVHAVQGKRVATSFFGEEKAPDGSAQAVFCETMGDNDRGRTLKALDDWLGPGHPLRSGSGHEFQLKRGRAWPLAETDKKSVDAARAAGNYYFLLAFDHKGTTSLSLRRWRSATPAAQATPPAPASGAAAKTSPSS
jgi:hypothetical protein